MLNIANKLEKSKVKYLVNWYDAEGYRKYRSYMEKEAVVTAPESAVEFTIRVWVKSEDYWPLKFHLTEQIYNELPKHGIMFPFPQLDVNIKN